MSVHEHDESIGNERNDALDSAMAMVFGSHGTERDPVGSLDSSEFVGRYKLLEKIGEGGFGVVYMAEQREPISRRVALKVVKLVGDTKQVVARFEAERQALAMMDHENIASVLDAGATESGRPYFVMELVRGTTITDFCNRNKLSIPERLNLFVSVCKAVQHAHQKGIIHRDLKPSNVMVTLRDGQPIPKVIDFGIAKATQARLTEKTVFTRFGQFIGTPAYMSPEQAEMGELDVDTRSDIYSLGVLLYELLTGTTPVGHEELRSAGYAEMQRIICERDPPVPSTRLSQSGETLATISAQRATEPKKLGQLVRGELDWIVMKALEKDRTRRYETALGLAMDVGRHLRNEPIIAGPPGVAYRLSKIVRRHQKTFATLVAFFLLMVCATVFSVWQAIRAYDAERVVEVERDNLLAEQRRAAEADRLRQTDRVAALLTASSESVPVLVEEMRSARELVLPLIRNRFEQANQREDRLRLAIAQTLLNEPKLEILADGVVDAHPGECTNLLRAFRVHRHQGTLLLEERLGSAKDNEQAQFRYAVLLLELGIPEPASDLLSLRQNPERRTRFIHSFQDWHGDLAAVPELLRDSRHNELQSGLAVALGRMDSTDIPTPTRSAIESALRDVYLSADDSGVHSACRWALNRWDVALPEITPSRLRPGVKQHWFVNREGHTMLIVGLIGERRASRVPSFYWPFAIADREISVADFRRFLDDPDYPQQWKPDDWPGVKPELCPSEVCPVTRVNLVDVMLYCNWLSRTQEREVCYQQSSDGAWSCRFDADGYRLPISHEWDYAAYAGAGTRFPFGEDEFMLPEYGNLLLRHTQPGAELMPNAWGLFDTLGNVWEMCHNTAVEQVLGFPADTVAQKELRIHGATYGVGSYYLRRDTSYPADTGRTTDMGFRVCCGLSALTPEQIRLSSENWVSDWDRRVVEEVNRSEFRARLAAGDQAFFTTPDSPQNRDPIGGTTQSDFLVRLEASPFSSRSEEIGHLASHWQVRAADGSYSTAVIHHSSLEELTSLTIERGVLSPNKKYYWRVSYTGSNLRTTANSPETSFTTGDFPMRTIPFDLTPYFNRDVIKNADDEETDSIDASSGTYFIEAGFDGVRRDNPKADGLPPNREVGIHVLGDYSSNNVIQVSFSDQDQTPIRIAVPPIRYHFVRFLVAGGNGNSNMPVRFIYDDGTSQREVIRCDDWFYDINSNIFGKARAGLLPVLNDMDRFFQGEFIDDNATAVFEYAIKVDSACQLMAFELETDSDDAQYLDDKLWPNYARAHFNLFAVTGVTVGTNGEL